MKTLLNNGEGTERSNSSEMRAGLADLGHRSPVSAGERVIENIT
jgi:hypothetical protein